MGLTQITATVPTEPSPKRVWVAARSEAAGPDRTRRRGNLPGREGRRSEWPGPNRLGAADQWLEEDEPVFVHPRDPYKRVDILASSWHVRIELDGVTIADSPQPRILFETGLDRAVLPAHHRRAWRSVAQLRHHHPLPL